MSKRFTNRLEKALYASPSLADSARSSSCRWSSPAKTPSDAIRSAPLSGDIPPRPASPCSTRMALTSIPSVPRLMAVSEKGVTDRASTWA
jgi:hypothetical protein